MAAPPAAAMSTLLPGPPPPSFGLQRPAVARRLAIATSMRVAHGSSWAAAGRLSQSTTAT
eukprot:1831236-Alexandrium_andersonii.AAC.1